MKVWRETYHTAKCHKAAKKKNKKEEEEKEVKWEKEINIFKRS